MKLGHLLTLGLLALTMNVMAHSDVIDFRGRGEIGTKFNRFLDSENEFVFELREDSGYVEELKLSTEGKKGTDGTVIVYADHKEIAKISAPGSRQEMVIPVREIVSVIRLRIEDNSLVKFHDFKIYTKKKSK